MTMISQVKRTIPYKNGTAVTQNGGAVACWYVVRSNHREERRACFYLRHGGFEVYLPLKHSKRDKSDLSQHHPLFPGYLFIQVPELAAKWHEVFTTPGVDSILCDGNRPRRVRPGLIERLRDKEIEGLIMIQPAAPAAEPKPVRKGETKPARKPEINLALADLDQVVALLVTEGVASNRDFALTMILERDPRVVLALEGT